MSSKRCPKTGLSVSYAYKRGCRCEACRANKAVYTANEGEKARERARKWHKENPERVKQHRKRSADRRWLKAWGDLLEKQNGKCAVCGRGGADPDMSNSSKRLCVDHCHDTGAIRGLLCGHCNVGLGHFQDDPELLQAAIDYLENGDVL